MTPQQRQDNERKKINDMLTKHKGRASSISECSSGMAQRHFSECVAEEEMNIIDAIDSSSLPEDEKKAFKERAAILTDIPFVFTELDESAPVNQDVPPSRIIKF